MSQLSKTKNYHESTKIGKHEKGQRGSVFVIRDLACKGISDSIYKRQ
jgi:hypothetical protein